MAVADRATSRADQGSGTDASPCAWATTTVLRHLADGDMFAGPDRGRGLLVKRGLGG